MSRPIVIYSYNRPKYFKQVLASLKDQVGSNEIFLFQDGPTNNIDRPLVDECEYLFQQTFSNGTVFKSEQNLGVAFNQKRGRDFIFSRTDSAIFVEDDIVLNSYYLDTLNSLMDAFNADEDIAMVSCFGEPHTNRRVFPILPYLKEDSDWTKEQEINKHYFMQMEHLWAYGFFRRAYDKIRDKLENYYKLIPAIYSNRPHGEILKYANDLGLNPNKAVSSQDSIVSGLLVINNMIKISTFTMNAQYIGEIGVHSNPQAFKAHWGTVTPYNKPVNQYMWDNRIKQFLINANRSKFT